MHRGYIKIWRKTLDSGLLQMPNALALFVYMLMEATHKPIRYGTVELERGQLVTGRHKLSKELNMSEQTVRTCIEHLIQFEFITSKPTNKFTVYTIVNYSKYQDIDQLPNQQDNQQLTNKQPTTNQQLTTIQEHKHINTKEEIHIANGKPICPHQEIIALYHEILPASPSIRDWTPARSAALKARWNESPDRQNLEYWKGLFEYIAGVPFLIGKVQKEGRKPFVLSLDWLVKPDNFAKVREGRYE